MVQHPVIDGHIAVEREAQVADASCLSLLHQPVQQSVVQIALVQVLHAAAYRVQQQVVNVIRLQILQTVLKHLLTGLQAVLLRTEVGQLGGQEILVPAVAALLQGDTQGGFALAPAVGWRCVKVVDTVIQGILAQAVALFLVYGIAVYILLRTGAGVLDGRQSHPSVSQDAYLLIGLRVHPVGHLVRRNLTRMVSHIIYLSVAVGTSGTTTCQSRSCCHSTRHLQEISSVILFHIH